jgi:hypothetical protein
MPQPDLDRLMKLLAQAPRQVIHGVVGPSGAGVGHEPGKSAWDMWAHLEAWCTPGGSVRKSKVVVRREIDPAEAEAYQELLPEYGVVALEVGLLEETDFQYPQALLYRVLPVPSPGSPLFAVAEKLRAPVEVEDEVFGTFTLVPSLGWYEAMTVWPGDGEWEVSLNLKASNDNRDFPQDSLAQARKLWSHWERWDREIRAFMVAELLRLKNSPTFLEEGETELSGEEFLERVSVESIDVNADGSFEMGYDDGDLFFGKQIKISGSLDGGLTEASFY